MKVGSKYQCLFDPTGFQRVIRVVKVEDLGLKDQRLKGWFGVSCQVTGDPVNDEVVGPDKFVQYLDRTENWDNMFRRIG